MRNVRKNRDWTEEKPIGEVNENLFSGGDACRGSICF